MTGSGPQLLETGLQPDQKDMTLPAGDAVDLWADFYRLAPLAQGTYRLTVRVEADCPDGSVQELAPSAVFEIP